MVSRACSVGIETKDTRSSENRWQLLIPPQCSLFAPANDVLQLPGCDQPVVGRYGEATRPVFRCLRTIEAAQVVSVGVIVEGIEQGVTIFRCHSHLPKQPP